MRLFQQLGSIVMHGFRLAFFLPANRNAFDASYVASAIVLALIGCVWFGLDLSIIGADEETPWLFYALAALLRPFVFSVGVAGLGRALSQRLPFRMLLASLAGTMWAPDAAGLMLDRIHQYLEVNLAESPWPEGITSAMVWYSGLLVLQLSLIAWVALVLYRNVRRPIHPICVIFRRSSIEGVADVRGNRSIAIDPYATCWRDEVSIVRLRPHQQGRTVPGR